MIHFIIGREVTDLKALRLAKRAHKRMLANNKISAEQSFFVFAHIVVFTKICNNFEKCSSLKSLIITVSYSFVYEGDIAFALKLLLKFF